MNNFVKWNAGWMKKIYDKGQRGGRTQTLHQQYCRRVLHANKKKNKRNVEVAAFAPLKRGRKKKKKKKKKSRRGVTTAAVAPMLRSPVMTRSR